MVEKARLQESLLFQHRCQVELRSCRGQQVRAAHNRIHTKVQIIDERTQLVGRIPVFLAHHKIAHQPGGRQVLVSSSAPAVA